MPNWREIPLDVDYLNMLDKILKKQNITILVIKGNNPMSLSLRVGVPPCTPKTCAHVSGKKGFKEP